MTKSNIGKVFIGMVLMVGSAQAGQWQFSRQSTLVPVGPEEAALGIQTLRVHSSGRVEILNLDQQVVGELMDRKAAVTPASDKTEGTRRGAPEETIELSFQGRHVAVHYKDRAIWISDGRNTATASFDNTDPADVERLKMFADDLRLIAGVQVASQAAIPHTGVIRTTSAGVLGAFGFDRAAKIVPASWASKLPAWLGGSPAGFDEPVCHTEPAHAKCAGGFGASRSSGCAWAQQEANNECTRASGWCYGCCAWIGSGCDCACLFGDLACMCESCGGLCGPPAMKPTATGAAGAEAAK